MSSASSASSSAPLTWTAPRKLEKAESAALRAALDMRLRGIFEEVDPALSEYITLLASTRPLSYVLAELAVFDMPDAAAKETVAWLYDYLRGVFAGTVGGSGSGSDTGGGGGSSGVRRDGTATRDTLPSHTDHRGRSRSRSKSRSRSPQQQQRHGGASSRSPPAHSGDNRGDARWRAPAFDSRRSGDGREAHRGEIDSRQSRAPASDSGWRRDGRGGRPPSPEPSDRWSRSRFDSSAARRSPPRRELPQGDDMSRRGGLHPSLAGDTTASVDAGRSGASGRPAGGPRASDAARNFAARTLQHQTLLVDASGVGRGGSSSTGGTAPATAGAPQRKADDGDAAAGAPLGAADVPPMAADGAASSKPPIVTRKRKLADGDAATATAEGAPPPPATSTASGSGAAWRALLLQSPPSAPQASANSAPADYQAYSPSARRGRGRGGIVRGRGGAASTRGGAVATARPVVPREMRTYVAPAAAVAAPQPQAASAPAGVEVAGALGRLQSEAAVATVAESHPAPSAAQHLRGRGRGRGASGVTRGRGGGRGVGAAAAVTIPHAAAKWVNTRLIPCK